MASRTLIYVVTEDWYFASHRLPLAAAAVASGYNVFVATRVREHEAVLRSVGCNVVPLHWRRSGESTVGHLSAVAELVSVFRSVRPDLVHNVALKPVIFGSLAARLAGVPARVNAVAGLGNLGGTRGCKAEVLRIGLRLALRALLDGEGTRVVVQNPDDRDVLVHLGLAKRERTVLIRGAGVDLKAFAPTVRASAEPVVLLSARLLWAKGVGDFVSAATCLRDQGTAARFVLVGEPDIDNSDSVPREQLQAWAKAGHVEWWGFRRDMPTVFAIADIACLPSRYGEGVPKVLLEAAASGLPIVATDTPGCREVVRHGQNGLLVPVGDVTALATALRSLIENRTARESMGRRSREIAEAAFSDNEVAAATLAVYRELLR